MARPVVGITTYVTDARWGYWNLEAALIPFDYVRAVEQAGGRPMLVPPSLDGVEETLDALDAVVFTGGSDLDPEFYGEKAHAETFGVVRLRDEAELALLRAALDRDMPVVLGTTLVLALAMRAGTAFSSAIPNYAGVRL